MAPVAHRGVFGENRAHRGVGPPGGLGRPAGRTDGPPGGLRGGSAAHRGVGVAGGPTRGLRGGQLLISTHLKGLVYCAAILADGIFSGVILKRFRHRNHLCDARV